MRPAPASTSARSAAAAETAAQLCSPFDLEFFNTHGYWLGPQLISPAEIEECRAAMEQLYAGNYATGQPPWSCNWKPGDAPQALRKMDNCHWSSPTLRRLALNETIGAIAARLIGSPSISLWHDQLLHKPGRPATATTPPPPAGSAAANAANVGWHQDYHYWQCSDRPQMITAWVALDDVTEANGCMQMVPGSHRWGLLDENDFFDQDIEGAAQRMKLPPGARWSTALCELRPGAVSFHHGLTIHGSGPNRSPAPRRSLVIHMVGGDCRFIGGTWCDEHMNALLLAREHGSGLPPTGAPWAGRYFPRIWPAEN